MSAFLLPVSVLLLAAIQAALPAIGWLGGVRLELLPAVVVYGALTASRPARTILIAALAGVAQDSLSAGPFGFSVIGFVLPALVLAWSEESLDRDLPWVQVGAGMWVASVNAAVACLVAGLTFGGIVKIVLLAMMSGFIAPALFLVVEVLRYVTQTTDS